MTIDKNDYFKYIDLNNNITPCQKKMLKYYFDNLNTFYVDKKSNVQTKTLITNCYKNNLVTKIAKIKNLFYTFFNKEFTDELFRKISKEKLSDIDFDRCQMRINEGKGKKDRIVPYPTAFREILAIHVDNSIKNKQIYLFESSWKKPYTDRGIRKILAQYTQKSGIEHSISPHKLRHFLFTWMKKQGVDDALLQPYSGHESRQSLEMYSKLSLNDAQPVYDSKIKDFPV
jgi:integrase/recombinase XerD